MSELPQPRTFALVVDAGVATITLDRAERLNALTFDIYRELAETFEDLDRHDEVIRLDPFTRQVYAFGDLGERA